MRWRERPVILLGHGARLAGADCAPLLDIGLPILTSWLAKDLIDNTHPNYFGSPGVYGQRMANQVLYAADQVIAIGNRLSVWNAGHTGLRPEQELWMCDADEKEVARHKGAIHIRQSLESFVAALAEQRIRRDEWLTQCAKWRERYPLVESPAHDSVDGYVNTYRFMQALEPLLAPDEVIVTDAGTLMCPAFQVLRVKPPQRIITSGGLGEMGCGLPMAIGASFARGKGRVLCMVGDGGMMLNLQELATIAHHRLPVKVIVFSNDGYTMIKHSQRALGYVRSGVDTKSGVSMPHFLPIAAAFYMPYTGIYMPSFLNDGESLYGIVENGGPAIIEVICHPDQPAVPKLNPIKREDGTVGSPAFNEMSP